LDFWDNDCLCNFIFISRNPKLLFLKMASQTPREKSFNEGFNYGLTEGKNKIIEQIMPMLENLIKKSKDADNGIGTFCIKTKHIINIKNKIK
jgi:hypothetical protein